MPAIALWWCCLPALEKAAWILCGVNFIINPAYIERHLVDDLFMTSGELGNLKRLPLFVYMAGLVPGVVVIDEVEIEVYTYGAFGVRSYPEFWAAANFFCACRCEILRFPDPC